MAKDMKTGKYVPDHGLDFKVWVEASRLTAEGNDAKLGYLASEESDHNLPPGSRMRAVQVQSAGGIVRWLPCYSTDATLWIGSATSITMDPFAGSGTTPVEFTLTGLRRSEKIRGKRIDTGHVSE